MNRHVKIFFFILLVICSKDMQAQDDYKIPDYERYADEIISSFEREMQQKIGLQPIGSGGSMPYDVEGIEVLFRSNKRSSIEAAREMEVAAVERLTQIINNDEKIRPYLREYPFPSKRVKISISFHDLNDLHFMDGSVASVSHIRDQIFYDYCEHQKKDNPHYHEYYPYDLVDLYDEPYCEALKIVKNKYSSNKFSPCQICYNEFIHDYAKEMKKDFKLYLTEDSGCKPNEIDEVSLKFLCFEDRVQIEDARRLEIMATESLLKSVNSSEKIKPYLKNYSGKVKVEIVFQGSDYRYNLDDNMALATKKDNAIQYYIAKTEKGDLVHFIDEDYDKAAKIVQKKAPSYEKELKEKVEILRNSFGPYNWSRAYGNRIEKAIFEAEKELNLKPNIEWISFLGRPGVNKINAHFCSGEKVTLEEARKLEVKAVDKLLEIVNGYKKMRPYLSAHPFPVEGLWMTIRFRNADGTSFGDDYIGEIKLEKGILYYYKKQDKKILEEPYSVAKKRFRKS